MRNLWMIVSGLAVVVAIGGAVYYFFPKQPMNPEVSSAAPLAPPSGSSVLVVPASNPLLTADKAQLEQWVSLYPIRCGEIVFEKVDAKSRNFNFCVGEIRRRVTHDTGTAINREEVLDANVRAHWRSVMGSK
ncbi:hypothetical protein AWB79_05021 [Caballeronia hypogeia]|uniref:Uncharacterized protein n=1 Tax=Caballeronia hypogeia TaxID=1777140 RepID=A0A158CCT7_9BURK|nr:hypothetical protein [Caballeronia hypogeia]SAK79337.1 hypothetical protein AWB79_05021 [Caballeronia hypogeia]